MSIISPLAALAVVALGIASSTDEVNAATPAYGAPVPTSSPAVSARASVLAQNTTPSPSASASSSPSPVPTNTALSVVAGVLIFTGGGGGSPPAASVGAQTGPSVTYDITVPFTADGLPQPTGFTVICDVGTNLAYSATSVAGTVLGTASAPVFVQGAGLTGYTAPGKAYHTQIAVYPVVQRAALTASVQPMYLCFATGKTISGGAVTGSHSVHGSVPMPS